MTDKRDLTLVQGRNEDEEAYSAALVDLAKEVLPFVQSSPSLDDLSEWLDGYGNGSFELPILPRTYAAEYDNYRPMTVKEVADDLGVSCAYVRKLLRTKKMHGSLDMGEWRIDPGYVSGYATKTYKPQIVGSSVDIDVDGSHGYSLPGVHVQYGDRREAKRIFSSAFPGATGSLRFVLTYDSGKTRTIQYRVTASGARKMFEIWEEAE